MKTIIIVDLNDPIDLEKFKSIDKFNVADDMIKKGITTIGYDQLSGDIIVAIENGKLIYSSTDDIKFKSILELMFDNNIQS